MLSVWNESFNNSGSDVPQPRLEAEKLVLGRLVLMGSSFLIVSLKGGDGGERRGLSEGELADNTSAIAGEVTNASSEDYLEDDNESVELNGNLSGSKLV